MIDGEGHVRITDFGLAAIAGSVTDVRGGTPAYMAPEQLAGRDASAKSDIYALGLVLFELFTGKRVFEATTFNELLRLHESRNVVSPSSVIRDLNPSIERAIIRCLDPDPAERPSSPLTVAASLPGGNQLAAAIAAGETPSPEMVAAAGEQSAVPAALGLSLVAFTLLMLAVLTLLSERYSIVHRIPLPKSIDSLTDRAQELLERIGTAIRRTTRRAGGRSTANTSITPPLIRFSNPAPRSHPGAPGRSFSGTGRAPRASCRSRRASCRIRPIRPLRCPACVSFVSTPRGGCWSSTR